MFFGIIVLIIGILLAVGLHELGHLAPAKKFGVKVPQYFIGFGPTLWSTKRGETEYGLKAIPLGGYVSLAGMLAPAKAGTPIHDKDGNLTLAEEARRDSAAELEPGEEHKAFWRLSVPKKLTVMFGGPVMNLVLATVLMAVIMLGLGLPRYSTEVSAVSPCITECSKDATPSPAKAAGFETGDVITSWNGVEMGEWTEVQDAIAKGGTGETKVEIIRDGETKILSVTPVMTERPLADGGTAVKPYVGISPGTERVRSANVLGETASMTVQTAKALIKLPQNLFSTARSTVTGEERDQTGVVGIVGVADIAGQVTTASGVSIVDRLAAVLSIMVSLNLTLFLFNLIPLLPLDGGHILGAGIEGVRRWIAKLRGKPDPGPFDTARLLPLSNIVMWALIAMTLILVVADIVNPII